MGGNENPNNRTSSRNPSRENDVAKSPLLNRYKSNENVPTNNESDNISPKDTVKPCLLLKNFFLLNIHGLITTVHPQDKINLLRETMYEEKPLLLALTETWLHDHREAEVYIENYNLFRKDRPVRTTIGRGRHVGGVALYVKSSWLPDSVEILGYSNTAVDVLVIHSKRENSIIAVLYR